MAILLLLATPCAAQSAPVYEFDIPAEKLTQALKDFSASSSQQIVFSDDVVGDRRSPALRGRFTSEEALGILLEGTDLRADRSKAGVIMVRVQPSQPPQNDVTSPADDKAMETIVVTGTLMHGVIEPTGSKITQLTADNIAKLGVNSAPELLDTIPQVQAFNTIQAPNADWGSPSTPVNLRGLGSYGAGTLVLLNGHRIVGEGVLQTAVDPDMIPADVLERVDVLPDGGSSTYGSDAIGGVINFITRSSFDGVQVHARYGSADHYSMLNFVAIAGTAWEGGSAVVSYSHAYHDPLLGKYRGYVTEDHTATGGMDNRSTICGFGNITVDGIHYAAPYFVADTQNKCTSTDGMSIYPRETRDGVFGYLEQRIAPSLLFSIDAYWSMRNTTVYGYSGEFDAVQSGGTITSANPYFHAVGPETSQTVSYSYANSLGAAVSPQYFTAYGITPKLTWSVSDDWQLRLELNYGESFAHVENRGMINSQAETAALAGTTTATALDPYDAARTDPAVLAAIKNWEQDGRGTQVLADARLVVEGALVTLPAGDIRLAVGAEYKRNALHDFNSIGPIGQGLNATIASLSRSSYAMFGELLVPVVGEGNRKPLVHSLALTASLRYDNYSDFGSTGNPRYGIDYWPFADLRFRGQYQTAFHAPDLTANNNMISTYVSMLPYSPYYMPSNTGNAALDALIDQQNMARKTVYVSGAGTDLRPETADTFSFGGDFTPHQVPGLKLGLTYWHTSYKNIVDIVHPGAPDYFTNPAWSPTYLVNPTLAQLQTLLAGIPLAGITSLSALYASGQSPYLFIDARLHNIGAVKAGGLDFDASYAREVSFGTVFGSLAGSYKLMREQQLIAGSPFTDYLSNGTTPRLGLIAMVGASAGLFTGSVDAKYNSGYDVPPTVILNSQYHQTYVDSFMTIGLYLKADLGAFNLIKDSELSINIDNLFDQDPPYSNLGSGIGYTNGGTLGRLITVGIRAKL